MVDLNRSPRFALRASVTWFAIGLLLALATSGGIAGERISRGDFSVALLANVVTTVVALVAVLLTIRRVGVSFTGASALVPQGLGAVAGIVLVHLVLRHEALSLLPWLSERPAQFVNDLVAVAGVLALVWASANGLDVRLLALAFAGVTLYRVTSPAWHVDHAPGGFETSVQELVVAQFVAAALALGLFRTMLGRTAR